MKIFNAKRNKLAMVLVALLGLLMINACGKKDNINKSTVGTTVAIEESTITESVDDEANTDDTTLATEEKLEEIVTSSDATTEQDETTASKVEETTKAKYTVTKLDKTMYAKSTVNVRKGPSTDFEKVGSLSAGKQVKVVGQSDQTGWYLIQFDGKEGYVSNSYLQDKPVETTTPKPTTTKAPSTSSGKTETTTTQPQTTQKENPNAHKANKYVIAKNPDGSYDVKNCIIGNSSSGVPREQAEMDVYYIFLEKLGDKLVVPEGWEVLIGFQRRYMLCAHFDVRDWELIVMEKTNSGFCWIFDENFELKKVSFSETN